MILEWSSSKKKKPNNQSVATVLKAGGKRWKSMSDADKAPPFIQKAEKRKADYGDTLTAYNKRLAEGPTEEEQEDESVKSEVNEEDGEAESPTEEEREDKSDSMEMKKDMDMDMPEVLEMEKMMEKSEIARKIYFNRRLPTLLMDLDRPVSLETVINAIFRSAESSSSVEDDSASPNPNWSRFLTEDGHLLLDQLLSQPCPEGPMNRGFKQAIQSAARGVAYYNARNKGNEYELVAPLYSTAFSGGGLAFFIHGNFLAKPKWRPDSCVDLFFVEWATCGVHKPGNPIRVCEILKPGSSSSSDVDYMIIIHPPRYQDGFHCILPPASDSSTDSDSDGWI